MCVEPLGDVATAIKSANAGASWVTFDIVFADAADYERVTAAGVVTPATVADLYDVAADAVAVYHCDAVLTIKATIPRAGAGGADETDFDGVQQFVLLLDIPVPT